MLKRLEIGSYMNGYNFSQISCINLPIAAAAGYFNYDNYFYYCFNISALLNWGNSKNMSFKEYSSILAKLGLKIETKKLLSSSDLIPFIKSSIDEKHPVLFIADYASLFYTSTYLNENPSLHGIIISGYDCKKQIIALNETKTVDSDIHAEIKKYFNANPLFVMFLKEEYLLDIWNTRNEHFKKSNPDLVSTIYTMEKYDETGIGNYAEMITDFLDTYNIGNDRLIRFVNIFNKIRNNINSKFINQIRCDLHGSLEAFFDGIKMGIMGIMSADELNDYINFKHEYINSRSEILSRLYTYALRETDIDEEKKQSLIDSIKQKNKILSGNLIEWRKLAVNSLKSVNFALEALATADSEYKKDNVHCKASQAIDGKWSNWRVNLWVSEDKNVLHWLKVDLYSPKTINKIVVRHHDNKDFVTVDFEIYGSNDDKNWDILVKVSGNIEHITEHKITPCTYRYFRMDIIKPGEIDYSARIFEFETWGMK